ncbi:MAG: ATP-dependent DNA helicase RecG [Myxococcales bacterium]|nr:ATP-dependent DNA helicase RecG [Myxococcales bacterium]
MALLEAGEEADSSLVRGKGRVPALGKLCDRVLSKLGDDDKPGWEAWRRSLDGLGMMESDQRMVEAARGLRLCQMVAGRRQEHAFVPQSDSPLHQSTASLTGIGPKMAANLAERGIDTVEDLLWLVPRRYDDVRDVTELIDVLKSPPIGERVVLVGDIHSARFVRRGPRGWIYMRMHCVEGTLAIRWFGARAGMCSRYEEGGRAVLAGKISERAGACEMTNPDVLALTSASGEEITLVDGVVPRYSAIPGVPPATVRKAALAASKRGRDFIEEAVPAALSKELGMVSLTEALCQLHQPPDSLSTEEVQALNEGGSEWHRRLAFEELFVLATIVAKRKVAARGDKAHSYAHASDMVLRDALPFELTGAQKRVIGEIADDLQEPTPMNRLLQGDVGSGKTAVAFAAAHQVIAAGGQVALMAPTTILAEQHLRSLTPWCEKAGIRIALLTASTPKGVRASTLSLLAAGEVDLLLGTHALIADTVVFRQLGLVLIDEQHRFGVAQRVLLRSKGGEFAPHLLVMTATPIPRTLALAAYGDLDVGILDEMPPGRLAPRTQILLGAKGRAGAYETLERRLELGQRAYVVCPMVEAPEEETGRDYANACDIASELRTRYENYSVSLVHGRMSGEERDAAMAAFRSGESQVLVATTVIEVGVDVPEAVVIIIEDADHFGLAQLHQLRGRVGRGGGASECVLLSSGRASEEGRERLDVLVETSDGFVIAEEDLRMRGPGELLGARQAGLPKLRFGDLRSHGELLALAKERADLLLIEDPGLGEASHSVLRGLVESKEHEAYGAEGG